MEDKSTSVNESKEVSAQIQELRAHAQSLTALCQNLILMANGGVPALTVAQEAKEVSDGMKDAKETLDKVRKVLKPRAQAILKDC